VANGPVNTLSRPGRRWRKRYHCGERDL